MTYASTHFDHFPLFFVLSEQLEKLKARKIGDQPEAEDDGGEAERTAEAEAEFERAKV